MLDVLELALLLLFELALQLFQALFDHLLHLGDVLVADRFAGFDDDDVGVGEVDRRCGWACPACSRRLRLQPLAGLDDRVERLGDRFVEALLDLGAGAGSSSASVRSRPALISAIWALILDACSRSATVILSSRRLRAFWRASSST